MKASVILLFNVITTCRAYQFKDLVDESQPESFGHLTDDDFNDAALYDDVDIKQIIRDHLSQRGLLDPSYDDFLNHPIEKSGKFEGDIELPVDFALSTHNSYAQVAYAIIHANRQIWINNVIPYVISSRIGFLGRRNLAAAIADFHKFNEQDYVKILPSTGCWSYIGRKGGEQLLSLGAGCLDKHTIIHELMHASGFYHEQSRDDRDSYVDIFWQNILPGMEAQFTKQPNRIISLGTPYDLNSVMHYSEAAFSKYPGIGSSGYTLKAKSGERLGNLVGLTSTDILDLNILYNCDNAVTAVDGTTRPSHRSCTGKSKHMCSSGQCIEKSWMCDGYDDCGNNEDESDEICPIAVHSGDRIALKNRLNAEFLSCRYTSDHATDRCRTAPCSQSRRQEGDWERCKDETFQIYSHDSRGQNNPIRSGDKIALRSLDSVRSDHWLSCLEKGANCTSRNCSGFEMAFSGDCYGEEFFVYSPRRFGHCSNNINTNCQGDPLQQNDTVFLWSSSDSDGYHFWLSSRVKTDVCPGDYLDDYDEQSCRSEAWTLNIT